MSDPDIPVPTDLVATARTLAERIRSGATLLTHGRGARREDARHVAVEFTHPVIVGKRAVPAIVIDEAGDLGLLGHTGDVTILLGEAPTFIVVAARLGLEAIALDVARKDDLVASYHLLWELTHLFLESAPAVTDPDLAFLYGGVDPADAAARSLAEKRAEIVTLRQRVLAENEEQLDGCALVMADRIGRGGKVMVFGNGGSQTDAAALTIELRHAGVPAVNLAAEPAILTALGNDIGFEAVFARQLAAVGKRGDVAVALSTSGGSPNVLAALTEAGRRDVLTVGLAGYDGGPMADRGLVSHLFVIPSSSVHRIQEAQTSLYLTLADRVRNQLDRYAAASDQAGAAQPRGVPACSPSASWRLTSSISSSHVSCDLRPYGQPEAED